MATLQTYKPTTVSVESKALDDALGAVVVPLVDPINLFFKTSDVTQGLSKIRFIVYTSGKHRTWLWGWYDVSKQDFIIDDKCRYGTPGAKLIDLDRVSYANGFEDMSNTVKNRIQEVGDYGPPPNKHNLIANLYFLLTNTYPSRDDVNKLRKTAEVTYELNQGPYFLNLLLTQLEAANDEQKAIILSRKDNLFGTIKLLDPMWDYKDSSAANRHRLYTYNLAILDGQIIPRDLKSDVFDAISVQLNQDTLLTTHPTYIEYMRYWVTYYRDAINLVSITYSDLRRLTKLQQELVKTMTAKFGAWMRSGKIYRDEASLESCPTRNACELLSQQSPPDPLCTPWTFGTEVPEEVALA